jgi:glycosyltransferase involved in cell wall biosynthesis
MKILIIITDYGSFNNFLAELSTFLSDQSYEIHVITSRDNVINIKDKFDYGLYNIFFYNVAIPRGISIFKLLISSIKIRKLINRINPKLVHSHFTTANFPTILFKRPKTIYWGTFHGLGMNASTGIRKLIFSIVEYFCFLRLDVIYLVNNKDLALVRRNFAHKTIKYSSFGFGCDIKKFDKSLLTQQQLVSLKQQHSINHEFIITYTGRYVQFKGFDLVFKSFIQLTKAFPNQYKLLLIGGMDPIHSTGLNEKELVELEQEPSIINIGYTSEVNKYLALSDIFLFPSKKEGLPTCIVEALAMGVPVITLNERGNCDIVKNNYNGVLINSSNLETEVADIVASVRKLSLEKITLFKFSENASKERQNYDRQKFIDEHLKWYEELSQNPK